MAVYELTLPLDDATVEKLQVGDIIYLNGQVCTARDIAHLKLRELADAGKPFPEDLRGGAIFHAGPVMKKDAQGKWYLSVIGPTTSIRMEPHADFVGQQGVKVIIGKGGMGDVPRLRCRNISRFTFRPVRAVQLSWQQALSARKSLTGLSTACRRPCGRFRQSISDRSSSPWTRTATAAMTRYVTTHRRSKKKS